jgi:hypothetical protein
MSKSDTFLGLIVQYMPELMQKSEMDKLKSDLSDFLTETNYSGVENNWQFVLSSYDLQNIVKKRNQLHRKNLYKLDREAHSLRPEFIELAKEVSSEVDAKFINEILNIKNGF